MADSEIVIKFGGDTSGFDRALSGVNQKVTAFGTGTEGSMLKAGKASKEFKNLLHEAGGEVAGLGAAIKFTISPLIGILAGATAGFAALKEYIGSINDTSDKLEKGMSDPVFKMKDALRDAKKSLEQFLDSFLHWEKQGQKSPGDKLTENLREQLSLLDRQLATAEKLSAKDKEALEIQKLRVVHGLQGRALQRLSGMVGTDDAELRQAVAANIGVLSRTDSANAQSAIAADKDLLEKLGIRRDAAKNILTNTPGVIFDALKNIMGVGPSANDLAQQRIADYEAVKQQMKAAERRIEKNQDIVYREQQMRATAANRVEEAKSRLAGTRGQFDAMSMAIEQTRQAIVTGGGFGAGVPVDSPNQRVLNSLMSSQSRLHDWNRAHGIPDMMTGVLSAKAQQDPTSKNIEDLNSMFKKIITDSGMKVDLTVKDE